MTDLENIEKTAKDRVKKKMINDEYLKDVDMISQEHFKIDQKSKDLLFAPTLDKPISKKGDSFLAKISQKILNKLYFVIKHTVEKLFVKQSEYNEEVLRRLEDVEEKLGNRGKYPFDYLKFEDRFRGSRESIRKRQEVYLKYLNTDDHILDVGCGRGEFLELLKDKGFKNIAGLDIYKPFVQLCRSIDLQVVESDAINYLRATEDSSYDVITAFHVVEHMNNNYLMEFIKLCYDKLRSGGRLILETPNPKSLYIFTSAFYIDIYHITPLHPDSLAFIVTENKFNDVETLEFHTPEEKLEYKKKNEYIDKNFKKLNKIIYGPQDYAIIAKKKKN